MAGQARITSNGVIGNSGKPVRIWGYTQRSKSTGPGVVQLYDGTDATGNERWKGSGNTDEGALVNFTSVGKFFPTGCFVQIDSNVTYVEFDYEQVN